MTTLFDKIDEASLVSKYIDKHKGTKDGGSVTKKYSAAELHKHYNYKDDDVADGDETGHDPLSAHHRVVHSDRATQASAHANKLGTPAAHWTAAHAHAFAHDAHQIGVAFRRFCRDPKAVKLHTALRNHHYTQALHHLAKSGRSLSDLQDRVPHSFTDNHP